MAAALAADPLSIIILAAGRGTRMCSDEPKVLQSLAGRFFLEHLLETVQVLSPVRIDIVVHFKKDQIIHALKPIVEKWGLSSIVHWVDQGAMLGTGHAVQKALEQSVSPAESAARTLVLLGDGPLVRAETLKSFLDHIPSGALGLLTTHRPVHDGSGRIERSAHTGEVIRIIEECHLKTEADYAITEVNTGIMCAARDLWATLLPQICAQEKSGEYYLTDVVEHAPLVVAYQSPHEQELRGINTPLQKMDAEVFFQHRQIRALVEKTGVQLADPHHLIIRGSLTLGRGVFIDVGCVFEGEVFLGDGVCIGPYSVIKDTRIEAGARIFAFTVIEKAMIGVGAQVGPYARLRDSVLLEEGAQVGNFVELKKTHMGKKAKAKHLSYLGDATLGDDVNIGAGVITCNYDGQRKHQTVIEDGAFIGANTVIRAPLRIGKKARVGAGTTILKAVQAYTTVVNPKEQRIVSESSSAD